MQVEHLTDVLAAIPELGVLAGQVASSGVVLEGTLLVLDRRRPTRRRPAATALGRRGGGGRDRRVRGRRPAVVGWPGRDRLAVQRAAGTVCSRCCAMVSAAWSAAGLHGEGVTLGIAAASMGLDAISARQLSGRWHAGDAGELWQKLPVHAEPIAGPTSPAGAAPAPPARGLSGLRSPDPSGLGASSRPIAPLGAGPVDLSTR